jgi:hypothetical protein
MVENGKTKKEKKKKEEGKEKKERFVVHVCI